MSAASLRSEEKTKGKISTWLEEKGMKKTAQAARIKHILGRGSPCKRDYGVRQEVLKDEVEMRTQVSLVC